MSNINSYNSSIIQINNYDLIIDYQKKYNSYLQYVNEYISTMDGAIIIPSIFAIVRQNNSIRVNSFISNTRISASIVISDVAINSSASMLNLSMSMSALFNSNNRIYATPAVNVIIDSVRISGTNSMIILANKNVTVTQTLYISDVVISGSISANQYYMLSHWDSYNLSDLDSYTLQQMDSQSV